VLKKILIAGFCFLLMLSASGQITPAETEADGKSLELYNATRWTELLAFCRTSFESGIDFPLLRMRAGYSAFILGNYSECLVQYKKVLKVEPANETAIYFCYLSNLLLNNSSVSRFYAAKLPEITRKYEKIKRWKLNAVQGEFSFKKTTDSLRGNAIYQRIGVNFQPGFRTDFSISGALYSQVISETAFIAVRDSDNINIAQKELYARIGFSATHNLTLTGAFHYLYTPFNNFVYDNTVAMAGIKYHSPYINIQVAGNFANLADSTFNQYDATVSTYPFGNQKLYTITRFSYANDFTFSQVAGFGIAKGIWLEANLVAGSYSKLIENDGLYVYNDIDRKKFKAGASIYAVLFRKLTASLSYTGERKLKIFTTDNFFNQHSFNASLTWNF